MKRGVKLGMNLITWMFHESTLAPLIVEGHHSIHLTMLRSVTLSKARFSIKTVLKEKKTLYIIEPKYITIKRLILRNVLSLSILSNYACLIAGVF